MNLVGLRVSCTKCVLVWPVLSEVIQRQSKEDFVKIYYILESFVDL